MTRFSTSAGRAWSQAWAEIVRKHWRKPREAEPAEFETEYQRLKRIERTPR